LVAIDCTSRACTSKTMGKGVCVIQKRVMNLLEFSYFVVCFAVVGLALVRVLAGLAELDGFANLHLLDWAQKPRSETIGAAAAAALAGFLKMTGKVK
jgi:hypothetical protein